MINNFKYWFEQLAENANERKEKTPLENGQLPKWNNTTKNKEIKHKFTQEANQLKGITARSSNNDEAGGEWLYDLIWREYDSNNFTGVKLAMEIELSDMKERGLVYDFNKLLQSDAEYKVFVFQQKTINETKNLFAKFKLCVDNYNNKVESNFLLACWCWETNTFIFKDFKEPVK